MLEELPQLQWVQFNLSFNDFRLPLVKLTADEAQVVPDIFARGLGMDCKKKSFLYSSMARR